MGMPAAAPHYWTPEALRTLPDDATRHECIEGMHIVTPPPPPPPAPRAPHQRAVGELYFALRLYLNAQPIGSPSWQQDGCRRL